MSQSKSEHSDGFWNFELKPDKLQSYCAVQYTLDVFHYIYLRGLDGIEREGHIGDLIRFEEIAVQPFD